MPNQTVPAFLAALWEAHGKSTEGPWEVRDDDDGVVAKRRFVFQGKYIVQAPDLHAIVLTHNTLPSVLRMLEAYRATMEYAVSRLAPAAGLPAADDSAGALLQALARDVASFGEGSE